MAQLIQKLLGHKENVQRLLDSPRKPNGLLFVGPSGIGKKLSALALTQGLLCEKGTLCGSCGSCLRTEKGTHENLLLIATEEQQLKISDVEVVHSFLRLRLVGKARVIIIDEAHKLNSVAANSLLKILEEPPAHTYFILITSQESSLLPTIRSRTQTYRFKPLTRQELESLTEAPSWAYVSAQGRMDQLKKLIEQQESRQISVEALQSLFFGSLRSTRDLFLDYGKGKEEFLQLTHFWLQLMRDSLLPSPQRIHKDQEAFLTRLQQIPSEKREQLAQELLKSQGELMYNFDRTLFIENLWFQWNQSQN